MVSPSRSFLPLSLLIFPLAGWPAPAAADVLRFDTAEIVLTASRTFDGSMGLPNPFVDVDLTTEVTSPGGRQFLVDGFFDGDGAGGPVGNVFKIRVFADEAGLWSWTSHSNDPGLDGRAAASTAPARSPASSRPARWCAIPSTRAASVTARADRCS
jgi:hypothetical protein